MKGKPKIKAIIFDLGGVLMSAGYLSFVHHYCTACPTKQGYKKILQLEREVNLGNISEKQFYKKVHDTLHVELKPARMRQLIVKKMQVNKKLIALLPKLKKSKIILFSNSIGNMAREVLKQRRFPVKKIFDKVFFSNKIHLAKPDKKAYAYVLKHLKIKPSEALMVDDRKENILPVQRLGMHGLVFKNVRQFQKEIQKYQLV